MEQFLFDYIGKFMPLLDEEKKALIDLDIFKSFNKGDVLLKEGQSSKEGYFVLKGAIRVYYVNEGVEKTTEFYTEAQGLTPVCVTTGKPSEYFISCMEDSIVIVATSDMEQTMFEKFPRFETLCRILGEQLLAKNQQSFDNFKISSPEQRYLHLLETRPDLVQRVPQYYMASYLGITPQSLSRIRSRLLSK